MYLNLNMKTFIGRKLAVQNSNPSETSGSKRRKRSYFASGVMGFLIFSCLLFPVFASAESIMIDDFSTIQDRLTADLNNTPQSSSQTTASYDILGSERDMAIHYDGDEFGQTTGQVAGGTFRLGNDSSSQGEAYLVYDGDDGLPGVDYIGLRGVDPARPDQGADLTNSHTQCAFLVRLVSADHDGSFTLTVYSDEDNYSTTPSPIAFRQNDADLDIVVPFYEFTQSEGSGANFTDVGAIVVHIEKSQDLDIQLGFIQTIGILSSTKADSLYLDKNLNNEANPGDVIEYTVTVENTDPTNLDDMATNVVFTDTPDANTTLVEIASTTQGSASFLPDDTNPTSIRWNVGDLADGQEETIVFRARVNDPFPVGVPEVKNRGEFETDQCSSDDLHYLLWTDDVEDHDPNTPSDFTDTPVVATDPEIVATKNDGLSAGEFVGPGETVTYTIDITNNGLNKAENMVFTDPYDTDSTLFGSVETRLNGSPAGYAVSTENSQVKVTIGDLESGDTVTITFQVKVNDPFLDTVGYKLSNQGTVLYGEDPNQIVIKTDDDPNQSGSQVTETDVKFPVIVATKIDSPDPVQPGQNVTYTVVVKNDGNTTANNVIFSDTLQDNYSLNSGSLTASKGTPNVTEDQDGTTITVDIGDLEPGDANAVTIEFSVKVASSFPSMDPATISNQGTVAYDWNTGRKEEDTDDNDPPSGNDPTVTGVDAAASLVATKSDACFMDTNGDNLPDTEKPCPAEPGEFVRYTIHIENEGKMDATNVEFADTIDGNSTLVAGSVVAPGMTVDPNPADADVRVVVGDLAGDNASVDIQFDVRVADYLPANTDSISNQGTIKWDDSMERPTDDDPGEPGFQETVTPIKADPVIVATKINSTDTAVPDQVVTYTVVVKNDGNKTATGVSFSDALGDYCSLEGQVTTNPQHPTAINPDPTTIDVNIGELEPGDANAVTIVFSVRVASPFPALDPAQMSNQGTVSYDGENGTENKPTDDPDDPNSDKDPTVTEINAAPLISVEKTDSLLNDIDGDNIVDPGDTVRYEIVIRNTGDMDAANVDFTDPAVLNTAFIGNVRTDPGEPGVRITSGGTTPVTVKADTIAGNGGEVKIWFDVQVDDPFPANTNSIENRARVEGDNFDPKESDDPATDGDPDATVTPVSAAPVLSATKDDVLFGDADDDNFFGPGDTIRYNIVITNDGNMDAEDVLFTDDAVPNTTFLGNVTTNPGAPGVRVTSGGSTPVTVEIDTIPAAGGSVSISFDVRINDTLPEGIKYIENQGRITGGNLVVPHVDTDDPDTEDIVGDVTRTPLQPVNATKTAALTNDKNNNGVANPGDTIRYTIVIVNDGPEESTNTVFTDSEEMMVNTALVVGSVEKSQGNVIAGNSDGDAYVKVDLGTLPANGGEATVTFDVVIDDPFPSGEKKIYNQGDVEFRIGGQPLSVSTDWPDIAEDEYDRTVVEVVEPEPVIPTLSEIGTLLMALLLTVATLLVSRRKKA